MCSENRVQLQFVDYQLVMQEKFRMEVFVLTEWFGARGAATFWFECDGAFLNRCFFPIEINISYSFVYIKFTMPATSAHLIVILNRNFWTQTEIHKQCPRSLVS